MDAGGEVKRAEKGEDEMLGNELVGEERRG